ncbi:MAG: helix-turn-helix domain-containing protein [Terriglobia bacterium]
MRGVRLGRPVASATPDQVRDLTQQGLSVPEIAKRLHCSRSTVKRRLQEGLLTKGPCDDQVIPHGEGHGRTASGKGQNHLCVGQPGQNPVRQGQRCDPV